MKNEVEKIEQTRTKMLASQAWQLMPVISALKQARRKKKKKQRVLDRPEFQVKF